MSRRSTRSMKNSLSLCKDDELPEPIKRSRSTQKQGIIKESPKKSTKKVKAKVEDTSSSESDIENYLQPIDKIDLKSPFFDTKSSKEDVSSFDKIEKEIFSGVSVSRLSDSDSSDEEDYSKPIKTATAPEVETEEDILRKENIKQSIKEGEKVAKLNFLKLQDYKKRIEEAKKSVEEYNARKAELENKENIQKNECIDIQELLAAGEAKQNRDEVSDEVVQNHSAISLHSSSFETYDSEEEDWEEINEKQENETKDLVPQKELEITVEMPSTMKKKKGDDLLLAVKRRLNRIRKENQVLIHKVHLLCWIAHGNYVNSILNDQSMMALGLSLLPSEKSYPSGRLDLSYLEQILKWFRKTINISERVPSKSKSLHELLTEQIDKKEAYTKKMMVLIFIIVLRSLGIRCRLVLSFQVEPIRPHSSDLHFLGSAELKDKKSDASKSTNITVNSDIKKDSVAIGDAKTPIKPKNDSERNSKSIKDKQKSVEHKKNVTSIKENNIKKEMVEDKSKTSIKPKNDSERNSKSTKDKQKSVEHTTNVISKKENDIKKAVVENKSNIRAKKDNLESKTKSAKDKFSETLKELPENKQKNSNVKEKNQEKKLSLDKQNEIRSKSKSDEKATIPVVQLDRLNVSPMKKRRRSSDTKTVRSKSLVVNLNKLSDNQLKLRSKSTSTKDERKVKKSEKISQLDGSLDDLQDFKGFDNKCENEKKLDASSFENFYSQMYNRISTLKIPQVDGVSDEPSTSRPKLSNLKISKSSNEENCKSKRHSRITKKPNYADKNSSDSENCFEESPVKKLKTAKTRNTRDTAKESRVNLRKLRDIKYDKGSSNQPLDVKKDIMQLIKDRIAEQKALDKKRMVKNRLRKNNYDSDDSDYVPEAIKKKYHSDSDNDFSDKMKIKKRVQVKKAPVVKKIKKPKDPNSRKVISSDSEYTEEEGEKVKEKVKPKRKGNDTWLEVFLETEEKWMSVDVVFGQVHCVSQLYSRASHPVSYVVSWSNDNYLKDLTRRYCENYNTVTRKLRVDAEWWEQTLKSFLGPKTARDREEDDELNRQQLEKPLPSVISEYKNHPLYALERHLLKFEVIYPPNAPPLGYVRKEPVYSRDCVHICRSRDIWLKEAKVVKLGEKPYKIVKARPRYDKLSNTMITDQLLEIFGPWQVEDYVPPTAENGIVPRNAFGNVDLFKPSMLPKKCVHLQLPGLNKIAKRMNIDCASAIIGFDFHCGWSHPVYDGFIVCEEYEDQLVAAWNIEQEEMERKEQEKYEKRVYGNWKKLIKGLLIKERLKVKYGFGEEAAEGSSGVKRKKKGPSFCPKKRRVMSTSSEEDSGDDKK